MDTPNNTQPEDPKNTQDLKQSVDDFEMGNEQPAQPTQPHSPQVNHYASQQPQHQDQPQKPAAPVDPTAPAPEMPKRPTLQTPPPQKPLDRPPSPRKGGKPVDPNARKKALLGCFGAFGIAIALFFIFAFVFISTADPESVNPIARLLGLQQSQFVNSLITLIHVVFIIISLTAFVFTMIGLFRATMAKKGDKVSQKKGLKWSVISGSILIFILIIWMFVYLYLDSKRIPGADEILQPIVTEPEDTLLLTAPIEIRFDASNVPINKNKFQIVSYDWDFGDGATGTNQIVVHRYEEKGSFDVILKVTRRDKKTGEEFEDQYSALVSVENQALSAIFTADPQTGEAPLEVEFDASDSVDPDGEIDTYEWDLDGDGNFDDAEGPTAEYEFEKIGKYTVSLRVTSKTGEFDVTEKEIDVKENIDPEAVITLRDEPESFQTDESYIFRSEDSTSPNGDIDSYEWDFDDGSKVETTKTVSHTFESPGEYNVKLTITDEEGEEGEVIKTIIVKDPQGTPNASIETTPASLTGSVPFKVTFDGSGSTDSDDDIVDYAWDFDGDGTDDSFGQKATHTYTEEGTYTARLTVSDKEGNEGQSTAVVKVESQGISADISANRVEGNVPLTVSFDASASSYSDGAITSYKWDFGDGSATKLGAAKISHKYKEIGTYTATVTVIGDDNAQATAEILITVREIPISACFVSIFEEGPAPLTTTFDPGCSTGTVANYFWDFDDGGTSSSVKPTHTFEEAGEYTVILEISDTDNTVSEAELTITVTE